ncbi:(deoxy)nucleoside triphosphate pyrophosphohydrolase [Streptomyces sp. NBC_00572]|uniref:(deoxy)nucleoside triphosphate pyrophosphohydrolase n=1 Tax=Streptomyces sp. NBC_00572 TaxID=2903664 RepID=UPI00224E1EE5|nr:(deoxy)nucleoside triphosphate pyrophosphohydrolase [Streptomyces sp. NBC_00572]MCX4983217.1 (deoxy)nucleoside triphosphate pyrophosphohydrolase [Streptomyces sp. NBC_00572]
MTERTTDPATPHEPVVVVVAGALYDRGRLLAARRSAPVELAGRWELPGGKLEPGESPEEALVRELREELGVEVEPGERIPGEWPLKPGYVLRVWTARLLSGEPRPLEDHDALRWLARSELDSVDWLDQDRPAVAEAARWLPAAPGTGARD